MTTSAEYNAMIEAVTTEIIRFAKLSRDQHVSDLEAGDELGHTVETIIKAVMQHAQKQRQLEIN